MPTSVSSAGLLEPELSGSFSFVVEPGSLKCKLKCDIGLELELDTGTGDGGHDLLRPRVGGVWKTQVERGKFTEGDGGCAG